MILSSGIAPVVQLRAAGVPVGLGVDGSSSADSASLWMEARQAMLFAKLRDGAPAGTARMALECATLGGAACLGRAGELGVHRARRRRRRRRVAPDRPDLRRRARRPDRGLAALRAGVGVAHRSSTVASWCATAAIVHRDLDDVLRTHARHAARIQRLDD